MVDFTRPIFSARRCGLLAAIAPKIDGAAHDARSIRAALDAALDPTDEAQGELAANLKATTDSVHARLQTFASACSTRFANDQIGTLKDLQSVVSRTRSLALAMPVFFPHASLPRDSLTVSADAHFSPTDCKLVCADPPCSTLR
jgi:hypothetical protein